MNANEKVLNTFATRVRQMILQYEEVQAVKWAGIEEILDMIGLKKFIPYDESFIHFLFHLHQVNSLYQK